MPDDATGPVEYPAYFTDRDRLRVRYFHRRGRVVDIMVQLECFINGEWRQVRRYDTHMGLHVHTAPWDDARDRIEPLGAVDLNAVLTLAIGDIKGNWERYRAACEAALGAGSG